MVVVLLSSGLLRPGWGLEPTAHVDPFRDEAFSWVGAKDLFGFCGSSNRVGAIVPKRVRSAAVGRSPIHFMSDSASILARRTTVRRAAQG